MTFGTDRRDRYRELASRIRAIPGERFGLRPYTVAVRLRGYAGFELGEGGATDSVIDIVEANGQPPKVRVLNNEQLAVAGYSKQTWRIGPITPNFPGGGTVIEALTQVGLTSETEPHIILTGPEFPDGANFRTMRVDSDRAIHYTLEVQRVADSGTG